MRPGDKVTLLAYGDVEIERRVLAVRSRTVEVCAENQYESARRGGRVPAIGFPITDVVRVEAQPMGE